MISNQILQDTIEGIRIITKVDLVVMDVEGRVLAKTIEGLEGNMRTKRAVMVVPRDL